MFFFSPRTSQQATKPDRKSLSFGTHKLRQLTGNILQKLKRSPKTKKANNPDPDLEEDQPEIKEARFVSFIRPTAAPQIIDLQALKRKSLPQVTPVHVYRSNVSRSQAELVCPNLLRRQRSLRAARCSSSEMDMGTPLLRGGAERMPVLGLASDRWAAVAASAATFDDVRDYEGYELLDEEGADVDWSLLDLPEPVLWRLANESRHSLI